jgi:DNA polymerase phi
MFEIHKLTELMAQLLSRITTVSCSQIISLVTDASRSQGSVSGQEERDALFAQLFGLTSVVQSGLLLRSSSPSTSSAPADLSSFEQWLIELLMVGTKKSWLRESAGWTILLGVSALAQTDVSWRDDARTLLIHQVFVEDKIWTPEKVAILLRCQDEWKGTAWEDAIKGSWKHSNVLHSSNFGTLAKILKVRFAPLIAYFYIKQAEQESDDVDDGEESNKLSTGSWKPQLHFVWDILLERLLPASGSSSEKKNGSIQDFFRIVVDGKLELASRRDNN